MLFHPKEPININSITSEGWLPYSIMIGLMFISLFNLIAYSVQNVGISVTSVANKISLCIPVIFAFIYYGDSVSLIKVIGITLALFAVYFTSKNNEKNVFQFNFFIVPIVLFVGSGLLDVIFIHSLETFDLVNKGLVMKFSTILYTIAAIIGLPVLANSAFYK